MQMKRETLSTDEWHQVLTDGGSCLLQNASSWFYFYITEEDDPALDVEACTVEAHHTFPGMDISTLEASTKLFIRAVDGECSLWVTK